MGKLVPKLRFKEFSGEWEQSSIDELVKENILFKPLDGNHGNIHPKSSDFVDNGIPFVMANDIKYGQLDLEQCTKITKKQADSLKKGFSYTNDVLLTHKGTVGETALVTKLDTEYIMLTPQVTYYRVKNNKFFYNKFLLHIFRSPMFQRTISTLAGGGTRAYIGITEQRKLKLIYPSREEQQKIASCFSSLDNLIEAQNKKVEALKKHKKGLMQGLFPKDGENEPELRFDGFFGEWEEKKLGKVGNIITGNTPKTNDSENYGSDILFVSPADISESRYIYETNKKLSYKGFTKTRPIKSKSILVVCIGSTIGKVAQNNLECATNQQINTIVPFDEYCNDFIYSSLEKDAKKIKAIAGNHAVPLINKTEFSNIEILISKEKKEQQKIANTLSSIDALIESQNKKIEALKKHKKGLMQQMFVSGEK